MSDEASPEVETVKGPDPIESLDASDSRSNASTAEQDLSRLREHRVGEVEIDGLTVRIEEPRTFEQALQIIDATNNAQLLVRRSLAYLVTDPPPESETIESLSPWSKALLATAALDWLNLDELFADAESMAELRQAGEDAFQQ